MDAIDFKLSSLDAKDKERYYNELRCACESRDLCILLGAKDPVNLPEEDFKRISINLYNGMFGERYKTSCD